MIENISLPQDLRITIGSESKDFAVKAKRANPIIKSLSSIIFGTFFLAFVYAFLELTNFTVEDLEKMGPAVLIFGMFLLIGFGQLGSGIYSLFRKGGYFVGTPTRLVSYQKGKIRLIDWNQFTGDIKVSGDAQKGNISLYMRTGRMVSVQGPKYYVPDVIHMLGIPNALEIGQICVKRIKENTPSSTNNT